VLEAVAKPRTWRASGSNVRADTLWNRQVHAGRAFKICCATPDQAPAAIRQGNGDETRAAGAGKGQNRQALTI